MAYRPYYILFAGVNGAGKSTLYRTGLWQHGAENAALHRVNSDEIIVENGWDWRSRQDQMKAGKLAVRRINGYLKRHESFNQETTLTGRSIIRNIQSAYDRGYRIVMYYVCVSNPSLANERIAHRGEVGGHLVDEALVTKRYGSSLSNLAQVLSLCDEAYLYDNTVNLTLMARFKRDELAFYNPLARGLTWITRTLEALGYFEVNI